MWKPRKGKFSPDRPGEGIGRSIESVGNSLSHDMRAMSATAEVDTGKKPRIKMRPSPYGWFLLFLLVWIPLAAIVTVNNFLFIIFTMMIGLSVVSHRWARKNLASVSVVRRFPDEVFAETPFLLEYVVRSDREPWGSFTLTFAEETPLNGPGSQVTIAHVPKDRLHELVSSFSIASRGDKHIGPGTLSSSFPFGLAAYSKRCGPANSVLVFPKIEPVGDEIPSWVGGFGRGMERLDPFGTVPFSFRDYVAGDRFKHIDWKKSARTGALITRVLSEEGAREITIRLSGGASERAISRAASLVVHFIRSGRPVALEGPGIRTKPGYGPDWTRKLLTILARWDTMRQDIAESALTRRGIAVHIEGNGEFRWQRSE